MPAAMMAQHHYSFPVVTGIDARRPPAARKARMAVYQRLLAELDSNGQRISQQISEIDLADPADAQVLMPEQGGDILAHFGEDRFLERYQRYQAHIAEWRQKYPKLAAVDLRYDQQVVLQMPPGGTSVAQAAAEQQAAGECRERCGTAGQARRLPAAGGAQPPPAGKGPAKAPAKPKTSRKLLSRPRREGKRQEARGGQTRRAEREQAKSCPNQPLRPLRPGSASESRHEPED